MTIIYIGDSFCANYADPTRKSFHRQQGPREYSHMDMAAGDLGVDYVCHGYAGASWWFSWRHFKKWIPHNMDTMNNLTALVFFHTNAGRVNTSDRHILTASEDYERYVKYYMDLDFHLWAQEAFYKELSDRWSHVTTVHFINFGESYHHLLPGVVYTDNLYKLSLEDAAATDHPWPGIGEDGRPNHFGEAGNRRIADAVVDGIRNYSPGLRQMKL